MVGEIARAAGIAVAVRDAMAMLVANIVLAARLRDVGVMIVANIVLAARPARSSRISSFSHIAP